MGTDATVDTLDWNALPKIPLDRTTQNKKRVSGFFRAGWNHLGLFFQTSLLPLFRTNGENAFDTHMYPMSIGINFTI